MRNEITKVIAALAFASCIASCGESATSPMPEVVGEYAKKDITQSDSTTEYNVYFDLSDGMLYAYEEATTKNALKSIVNKISENKNCKEVYTLKNNDIQKSDLRQTDLYNYILDPKSYEKIAPLENTLAKIVQDNQPAFILTDFEEYVGGQIQQQNYAKKYFIDWLNKGNRIVFYVIDYVEKGKNKHVYFTVFDTPTHSLLKDIDDAFKGTGANPKVFNLNNNCITLSNNYPAKTIGGSYHSAEGKKEDVVSCLNETGSGDCYTIYPELNAEYYPFGETWGNIVTNAKATSEEGNNPVFTHLISGVSADFSNMDGYKVSELEIDVTDVQKDFDKFAGYYEYKKDNTKNVGDDGQISPEFDYTKGPGAITPVHDMFKFTGNVNGKKADIAIDMLPSFTGQVAGMTMSDLIKVDVKISKCEPNYDALSALFEWDGNTSLVEAVKNTLQEHNPKGKIIYTYYIKANE